MEIKELSKKTMKMIQKEIVENWGLIPSEEDDFGRYLQNQYQGYLIKRGGLH